MTKAQLRQDLTAVIDKAIQEGGALMKGGSKEVSCRLYNGRRAHVLIRIQGSLEKE